MPDRLADRHEHIQPLRDLERYRRTTRRIVGTAGAAAWLPHAKRRATGNGGRQRYLP
ncbi:hypothetical protein [Chloroflexus sp.]|uniref:hypothetical protein n=1 Tax=Chloroflexus sp. TaxID=1904827 RepID=UPI00404ABAAF